MVPAAVGFQCPDDVAAGQASVRAPRPTSRWQAARRQWGAVTLSLIGLNVVMFVVTAVSAVAGGSSPLDNQLSEVFARLCQVPVLVTLGDEWWRPLTAAFLHIGPVHLLLNMLALLVFGSELERRLGPARYLVLYGVALLGGGAAIQLFGEPFRAVAGASAAIYGLLGGLAVLMVQRREDLRGLVTLLAINVVISFLPGLSLLGHLGGLVAGALAATVYVAARRAPRLQLAGAAALGVVLLVLALTVPTVAVLGL